ncbi:Rlm1p [Kluyveromyces lactis]|uniref:KLLA0E24025p n=1 Tax=Kluyveromyces lactis (strain ATCC 8585 / CBS 2359 / DSM 70799 / NBRC 1267 / NRRL Y-1140 / WM37) TaxID=284590 RepID=Q6CM05_KLULA|nr:uncharacterized protein KLLA0_E24025g [Kluyveromyces lactis]CAH00121.1 KLLA0E24025p [Kluyveromyces lactis]|eukprot:XP_455034.1 uncharacterized protein KLLA0_E24025g [Kluyveromyces lactis]
MGRRKINIEPITHERNRTVTFIKRKAGLFKKAHELAVLCQVDVAVIILGHNNTFYEFSSVDTNDLIRHYQSDQLVHDIKEPSDYGDYVKKERVVLRPNRKRNAANRNAANAAVGPNVGAADTSSSVNSPDSRRVKRQLRSKGSVSTRSMSNGTQHGDDNEDDLDDDDMDDDDIDDDDIDDDDDDDIEDDDIDNEGGDGDINDSVTESRDHSNSSTMSNRGRSTKSQRSNATKKNKTRSRTVDSSVNLSTSNDKSIDNDGSNPRSIGSSGMNMTGAHSASATSLNSMSARHSPFVDMKTSSLPKQQGSSSGVELNAGLKFNPLQEHVQRQFHNLYNSKEPRIGTPVIQPQMVNSGFSRNNMSRIQDSSDVGSKLTVQSPMTALRTMLGGTTTPSPTDESPQHASGQTRMLKTHQQQKRPVLRVEIPTNNTTLPIKSEGDSAASDGQPKSATDSQRTPSNVMSQPLSSSPVIGDKSRTSVNSAANTGFLYNELTSGFVASPSVPQYFATPLQAQNNATSMLQIQNPQNYLMQRQLQYAQQQHQMQQQRIQLNNLQPKNRNPGQILATTTTTDHNSGPLTGSLPSKFAQDLIVQSPNTSIGGMFQEWPFPPNTSTAGRSNSSLPHLQMSHQQTGASQQHNSLLPTGQRQAMTSTSQQQSLQQHQQQQQQQQQHQQQQPSNDQTSGQQHQQQHVVSNGSPGLSPYINVSQTPTNKAFNFSDAGSTTYGSDKGSVDK